MAPQVEGDATCRTGVASPSDGSGALVETYVAAKVVVVTVCEMPNVLLGGLWISGYLAKSYCIGRYFTGTAKGTHRVPLARLNLLLLRRVCIDQIILLFFLLEVLRQNRPSADPDPACCLTCSCPTSISYVRVCSQTKVILA